MRTSVASSIETRISRALSTASLMVSSSIARGGAGPSSRRLMSMSNPTGGGGGAGPAAATSCRTATPTAAVKTQCPVPNRFWPFHPDTFNSPQCLSQEHCSGGSRGDLRSQLQQSDEYLRTSSFFSFCFAAPSSFSGLAGLVSGKVVDARIASCDATATAIRPSLRRSTMGMYWRTR